MSKTEENLNYATQILTLLATCSHVNLLRLFVVVVVVAFNETYHLCWCWFKTKNKFENITAQMLGLGLVGFMVH